MRSALCYGLTALLCASAYAEPTLSTNQPPAAEVPTNTLSAPKALSVEEVLVSGPPTLRLHSLAMISQGKVEGGVDERFLPAFAACAEDEIEPVRAFTARLLGEHFIKGKTSPNPEAVALLLKLADDPSPHVRLSAITQGLCLIEAKSPDIIARLLDAAAMDRMEGLIEAISTSLEPNRKEAAAILEEKLKTGENIAYFEIYEDILGTPAPYAELYLDQPSSMPKIFTVDCVEKNVEAFRAEFDARLGELLVGKYELTTTKYKQQPVLLLITYIIRDNQTVERTFSEHERFRLSYNEWLTPRIDQQLKALKMK